MKRWIKRTLATLFGVTLGLTVLTACTPTETDLEIIGEPIMTVTYDEEEKEYTVTLEGYAKNISGKDCEDARIQVQYYDSVGDPILYASDILYYLDAGETWHFYLKRTSENEPTRFEIEDAYADFVEEEEASK